jgi:hypothetical protein
MYPYYTGEKTWTSATDVANIQSLYGTPSSDYATGTFDRLEAVPEPSTIVLLILGLAMLIVRRIWIGSTQLSARHLSNCLLWKKRTGVELRNVVTSLARMVSFSTICL